jgi:hypothetical protein
MNHPSSMISSSRTRVRSTAIGPSAGPSRPHVVCKASPENRKQQLQHELAIVLASASLLSAGPAGAWGLENFQLPGFPPFQESQPKSQKELEEQFNNSDTLKVGNTHLACGSRMCA